MPDEELDKKTLFLRRGDFEAIQQHCAGTRLTASRVVRIVVSRYVDNVVRAEQPEPEPIKDIKL